ncbi:uncharacterized protein LOC141536864 isoform X2 [Cotesia typhae]|uniref:uncharacterized protein LOC141536054 isoform X1 n=1 Tax=Cotesia typhae TaxID=2053667 RepID=UPI003D68D79A
MIIVRTKCRCSSACSGVSLPDEQYKKQMNLFRCFACRQLRRKLQNRSYKVKPDIKSSYTDLKYQESLKTKQIQRLKRKNESLIKIIETQRLNCMAIKDEALRAEISILPPVQQLAIRACFNAVKAKNAKQRRYTVEWVYECLLLGIKMLRYMNDSENVKSSLFPAKTPLTNISRSWIALLVSLKPYSTLFVLKVHVWNHMKNGVSMHHSCHTLLLTANLKNANLKNATILTISNNST